VRSSSDDYLDTARTLGAARVLGQPVELASRTIVISRAMPYDRPGNLTANELYAVMAFLLSRNGIIREGDWADRES
jgi:hypothetical protein